MPKTQTLIINNLRFKTRKNHILQFLLKIRSERQRLTFRSAYNNYLSTK